MSEMIYQLLPSIRKGDAVSNDAFQMDALLKQAGFQTQLYADRIGEGLRSGLVLPADRMPIPDKGDLLLYHLSIGSPLHRRIETFGCRKVFVYHNITPFGFFAGFDPYTEAACRDGLREIAAMRDVPDYVLAVSGFNRDHLRSLGYSCPIDVLPILFPMDEYAGEPDAGVLERFRDGKCNILFTGRIAPNKKQEDLIAAFAEYHRSYNPDSRLLLVGNDGLKCYRKALKHYCECLGLTDRDVVFTGGVGLPELLAYYRAADIFLCLSEHEGFCVPLLEAMYFGVPIVAYDAGAVAETLGGCGVLLEDKAPARVAAVIDVLYRERTLREAVTAQQGERLKVYDEGRTAKQFLNAIESMLRKG